MPDTDFPEFQRHPPKMSLPTKWSGTLTRKPSAALTQVQCGFGGGKARGFGAKDD